MTPQNSTSVFGEKGKGNTNTTCMTLQFAPTNDDTQFVRPLYQVLAHEMASQVEGHFATTVN